MLLKQSFVIHLCCLKNIVFGKLTNFPKRYMSFLSKINLDNRVLLVSCVDLLKTEFTISLSELQVDHPSLYLEMNIFLLQFEFSSVESTEAFTESTDPANCFSWAGKRVQQFRFQTLHSTFFWRGQHAKTTISLPCYWKRFSCLWSRLTAVDPA